MTMCASPWVEIRPTEQEIDGRLVTGESEMPDGRTAYARQITSCRVKCARVCHFCSGGSLAGRNRISNKRKEQTTHESSAVGQSRAGRERVRSFSNRSCRPGPGPRTWGPREGFHTAEIRSRASGKRLIDHVSALQIVASMRRTLGVEWKHVLVPCIQATISLNELYL